MMLQDYYRKTIMQLEKESAVINKKINSQINWYNRQKRKIVTNYPLAEQALQLKYLQAQFKSIIIPNKKELRKRQNDIKILRDKNQKS